MEVNKDEENFVIAVGSRDDAVRLGYPCRCGGS
jgi:hypothetical protein